MKRLLTGSTMYFLCFCAPPIPFLLMGKQRQYGLAMWRRIARSRLASTMLSGLFWFFSLQLLSSGNQGGALLLYLMVVACSISSVRAKRIMSREAKRDNRANSLLHKALKQERGH